MPIPRAGEGWVRGACKEMLSKALGAATVMWPRGGGNHEAVGRVVERLVRGACRR